MAPYIDLGPPYKLDYPEKVIGVADDWILQPEDPLETTGYVHNVLFTCGAIAEDDGTLKIYWGAANTMLSLGTAYIAELYELCHTAPRRE